MAELIMPKFGAKIIGVRAEDKIPPLKIWGQSPFQAELRALFDNVAKKAM